jgi:hypothetical protein
MRDNAKPDVMLNGVKHLAWRDEDLVVASGFCEAISTPHGRNGIASSLTTLFAMTSPEVRRPTWMALYACGGCALL